MKHQHTDRVLQLIASLVGLVVMLLGMALWYLRGGGTETLLTATGMGITLTGGVLFAKNLYPTFTDVRLGRFADEMFYRWEQNAGRVMFPSLLTGIGLFGLFVWLKYLDLAKNPYAFHPANEEMALGVGILGAVAITIAAGSIFLQFKKMGEKPDYSFARKEDE